MCLVTPGPTQHLTGVICEDRRQRSPMQTTWFPAYSTVWYRYKNGQITPKRKLKHLHIMTTKCIDLTTIRMHSNFKIAIAHAIFMTVNEPKFIKLQPHHEIPKSRYIVENVSLFKHPSLHFDQSSLLIFFLTAYELQIRLLANASTSKSTWSTYWLQRLVHSAKDVSKWCPRQYRTCNSFPSVSIWRKLQMSKPFWYCSVYSNTRNGDVVITGATQRRRWLNFSFTSFDTSLSYNVQSGLFRVNGNRKVSNHRLDLYMTGTQWWVQE